MKAQTHGAAGVLLALVLAKLNVFSAIGHGYLLFALFGSLLPDIDNHNSKIGRKVPGFSNVAEFLLGHRGIYHSLFGCALTIFSFFMLFKVLALSGWLGYLTALAVGFLSHLVMDSLTENGIHWLKPFHGLHIRGPFQTGGIVDNLLSVSLLVATGAILKMIGWGFLKII